MIELIKRLNNRETTSTLNQEMQQGSFMPSLPFCRNQIINPFLNSRTLANHDKVDGLLVNGDWWNPYKEDCFSIVKSLLS